MMARGLCVWRAAVSATTPCWGPEPAKVCILYITRYMHDHRVWACGVFTLADTTILNVFSAHFIPYMCLSWSR